jgi:exo-beta-1,3-glucanase (GH17 family)
MDERLPRGNTPQPELPHASVPTVPAHTTPSHSPTRNDTHDIPSSPPREITRKLIGSPVAAVEESAPPPPPPHREQSGWQRDTTYSNVTQGEDNFSEQASGGLPGIALKVSDQNPRESGIEAMRNTPGYTSQPQQSQQQWDDSSYSGRPPPSHQPYYDDSQFSRGSPQSQWDEPAYHVRGGNGYYQDSPYSRPRPPQEMSQSSLTPLGAAAFPPGSATPSSRSTTSRSPNSYNDIPYSESPYRYSRNLDPALGAGIDPEMIADDGDDGLGYRPYGKGSNRGSLLSIGNHSDRNIAAGAGAAGGGVLGFMGGKSANSSTYGPVYPNVVPKEYDIATGQEKILRAERQRKKRKRLAWLIGVGVGLLVFGALIGGIAGGLLSRDDGGGSGNKPSGASAQQDKQENGDLNKDSAEIKKLMNNKALHKVFPGMDYTPMYTQYPECTKYPASQNNVTRDIAVLSQLTNIVRLYGTDCNATQMVIHAIDQLGLKGKMKIWMGVWQDKDKATNARQLQNMYDIFDEYGADDFLGIIMGNEVLFRGDFTIDELGTLISDTKKNLTAKGISLPVASSDLGDDWTQALADEVDYVMANIHPFFSGTVAEESAGWTWSFWQNHNVPLKADKSKHIISEVGWPSKGGTNCGAAATCAQGSVAAIPEMNTFLQDWVCPALANGTNYFWFSAYNEAWKIKESFPISLLSVLWFWLLVVEAVVEEVAFVSRLNTNLCYSLMNLGKNGKISGDLWISIEI